MSLQMIILILSFLFLQQNQINIKKFIMTLCKIIQQEYLKFAQKMDMSKFFLLNIYDEKIPVHLKVENLFAFF